MLADTDIYNRKGCLKLKRSRVLLLIEMELTLDFVKLSIICIRIPRVVIRKIGVAKGERLR